MRILKTVVSIVLIFASIFIIGGFMIQDKWVVSRATLIQANPVRIYALVSNFKAWQKWSPWNKEMDPTLQYSYQGRTAGIGSKQSWTSEKMGSGWMQFTSADPQNGVRYALFIDIKGSKSWLQGQIELAPADSATKVTWSDSADSEKNLGKRWMSLITRYMLGKEMDKGLAKLKTVAENPDNTV